jgi:hypothetical protein
VLDKIQRYIGKWIKRVNRLPRNRLSRITIKLHTKRQKEPGKTTYATFWMCEIGTGQQGPNQLGDDDDGENLKNVQGFIVYHSALQ